MPTRKNAGFGHAEVEGQREALMWASVSETRYRERSPALSVNAITFKTRSMLKDVFWAVCRQVRLPCQLACARGKS